MANIKIAYIGGGSSRAAGTMASLIEQGDNFDGSEVVLIDLDEDRLSVVKTIADKMARAKGIDLKVTTTLNRKEGLTDCDAILSSFRPGEFEARHLDESIPLKHGVIGQETQGPGGFFMALRSIHILADIVKEIEQVCPKAWIFNYTNPVNIVAQAVATQTNVPIVSLCEGPIIFPHWFCYSLDLDADKIKANMIGLNHGCWSTSQSYDGGDPFPIFVEAYEQRIKELGDDHRGLKMVRLAIEMRSLPADYFYYYYFRDHAFQTCRQKKTTRSQDIMAALPGYWAHYREQATMDVPVLDPERSRGGIHELELAIDAMDAMFNDRNEVLPCNVLNRGALPDFEDDVVVEVPCRIERTGINPLPQEHLPRTVVGLVKVLAEYQVLTANAAWSGDRKDAIRALASNPLVVDFDKAEAIYNEMAVAHKRYLPERLW